MALRSLRRICRLATKCVHFHNGIADHFGDLRDERVAECPQSVHPSGAAPAVQFIEPVRVTLRSITITLAWANLTPRSIQIGTPAQAKGSIPLRRSQGVVLSAMNRDIDSPLFRADESFDDPGAGGQGVSIYEDLALGAVNGIDGEDGAVFLWRKANRDRCARRHRCGGRCKRDRS